MDKLKIISMNAQGLRDKNKRKDVFNFLKNKNASIYFVQDTHFTDEEMKTIYIDFGFTCYFNNNDSRSRGVATFISKNIDFNLSTEYADKGGNLLILDCRIDNKSLTLVNIYGPNKDTPDFYQHIKNKIQEFNNPCIMAGDFNLILNPSIDCYDYLHLNNPKARDAVFDLMLDSNLIDCWRDLNMEKKEFTWFKKNTNKKSRLDFFLISNSLMTYVNDAKIVAGYRTDHSIISLNLDLDKFKKGSSYWKMNNSLLKDPLYVQLIKDKILQVKIQYIDDKDNDTNINELTDEDIKFNINDQLFFETLLFEIRGQTICYSSRIKKKEQLKEDNLLKEINNLEKDIHINHASLEEKKKELRIIRDKKMEGIKIRARAKWIEEGEKNSKFFCNLENQNFVSKSMTKLINKNGTEVIEQSEIIEEVKMFYKTLYSKRDTLDIELETIIDPHNFKTLSNEDKSSLENIFSKKECLESLKKMKNNKSPGMSGFTVEFFKFFWIDIGTFLVRSLNFGLKKGELSTSQKQGVITCIPKGNKDKCLLKNWRPISLLNVSYKIASATIANRLKPLLSKIINEDQTGFVNNRYIGENTRLIYDLMFYTEKYNIPGLLLLIDFEKAFDSISWSFISKVLDLFNFGPVFKNCINTFYHNTESCCLINGHMSEWFYLQRGCRQGDPISPYIFILCAELLAALVRNNENIKGIKIHDIEFRISQFADDTSLILDGSEKSLISSLQTLKFYGRISGLNINMEKTQIVWIGKNKNSNVRLCPHLNLCWDNTFTLLGIKFSTCLKDIIELNYEEKICQIKTLLNAWSKRILTPLGKITVIKTLALPKINHLIFSIPNPNESMVKEIETLFFTFLWDNKPDKIKRATIFKDYIDGGLRMVNINAFIIALKSTWVRRMILDNKNYLKLVYILNAKISDFLKVGPDYILQNLEHVENPFWKEVLESYARCCLSITPSKPHEINNVNILYNKNIKVGGSSIKNKQFLKHGIHVINDIIDKEGSFLSFEQFKQKYGDIVNFLEFSSVIASTRKYINHLNISTDTKHPDPNISLSIATLLKSKKGCRHIYDRIIYADKNTLSTCKWTEDLHTNLDIKKDRIFHIPIKIKCDPMLQWFQIRINHRILGTNFLLEKMKIKNSNICSYCKLEPETIIHLFFNCPQTTTFWKDLEHLINSRCFETSFSICAKTIIFGDNRASDVLNIILIMAKYYIFKHKENSQPLSVDAFKKQIPKYYQTEKYIANSNMNIEKFNKRWLPFLNLINYC